MLDDTDTVLITLNHLFNETNALYSKIAAELDLPESSFYVLYTLSVLATGSVYVAMFNEIYRKFRSQRYTPQRLC